MDQAIQRLFYWGAYADKFGGTVQVLLFTCFLTLSSDLCAATCTMYNLYTNRLSSFSQETTLYGATVRINEPVGVIGIACPDDFPLLAFVSLFAPAVVRGNTIVIIPSETAPLSATDLYQVT